MFRKLPEKKACYNKTKSSVITIEQLPRLKCTYESSRRNLIEFFHICIDITTDSAVIIINREKTKIRKYRQNFSLMELKVGRKGDQNLKNKLKDNKKRGKFANQQNSYEKCEM